MSKRFGLRVWGCILALTAMTHAHADVIVGEFTTVFGAPTELASGGTVTFSLQADGTIAAELVSFDGGIVGFGFDSVLAALPETNFSAPISNPYGWGTSLGSFASGFAGQAPFADHITWTIGFAGQFTSAASVVAGPNSNWDFFLYTVEGNQWGANALATSVPEPGSSMLFVLGLALFAVARGRARPPRVVTQR